ncbi:MAG: ABC transporter ATP-binding protein [Synergistaceae bacterium]|nr:ABC transporter ATP-binding protein [Synergistaceae bacterium]
MLKVRELSVSYGGIQALRGISLDVPVGKIVTLIGANGAGKSSTLRAIAGLVRNKSGSATWKEKHLLGLPPEDVLARGVALCPEGRRIFPHLTVLENLRLGGYSCKNKAEEEAGIERAFALFPRLRERSWQKGGTLSGGEQQMLAVGRALMSDPELIMFDEPSMGLAPILVEEVFDIIGQINKEGKTVLLVEQNAFAALKIADYAYVLEVGEITLQGPGEKLLTDPRVISAYLGG